MNLRFMTMTCLATVMLIAGNPVKVWAGESSFMLDHRMAYRSVEPDAPFFSMERLSISPNDGVALVLDHKWNFYFDAGRDSAPINSTSFKVDGDRIQLDGGERNGFHLGFGLSYRF